MGDPLTLHTATETSAMLTDVLSGLGSSPKTLPCKYFYDERGSQLFDAICGLDEYYLTRADVEIMEHSVGEMAAALGPECMVIEYGSGSGHKTRILLSALERPVAYVPVEISAEYLVQSAEALQRTFPEVEVLPVCADYTSNYRLPEPHRPPRRRVVYFPGSTIGNFTRQEAVRFLAHVAEVVGPAGGLLIGVDLVKDRATLESAYNDSLGVTAEFNLNLLERLNQELDADFDLEAFAHRAIYNEAAGRIEMHLVSSRDQVVRLGGRSFRFHRGEAIVTEHSHKYTLDGFANLARTAGFEVERVWTDRAGLFSTQYLGLARSD